MLQWYHNTSVIFLQYIFLKCNITVTQHPKPDASGMRNSECGMRNVHLYYIKESFISLPFCAFIILYINVTYNNSKVTLELQKCYTKSVYAFHNEEFGTRNEESFVSLKVNCKQFSSYILFIRISHHICIHSAFRTPHSAFTSVLRQKKKHRHTVGAIYTTIKL